MIQIYWYINMSSMFEVSNWHWEKTDLISNYLYKMTAGNIFLLSNGQSRNVGINSYQLHRSNGIFAYFFLKLQYIITVV